MSDSVLFWHRCDLRITDNLGLSAARQKSPHIVGVFCLDRNILSRDDLAPARIKYMLGCLEELQQAYQDLGSRLIVIEGEPVQAIPELAASLKVQAVYWNLDVEPYSQERDRLVQTALKNTNIKSQTFWDKLLHYPGEILTKSDLPYKVYTPFWRNWHQQTKVPIPKPITSLKDFTNNQQIAAEIQLPTLADLGFTWDQDLLLAPGEQAARSQLDSFAQKQIYEYDQQRNYPWQTGTSLLSAALKFGAIGIRTVWLATTEALTNCQSEEAQANILTWQKELAWREFYQHCLYYFPELAQGAYRQEFQNFPWENNQEYFQAWCQGKTGYPIVDAAMRQLNQTGWMHNRCRMIVASFLTKDLIIDWRWGEKYFMQKLFDGDLAANNGGWQWSASSGMDPKPLRIFNPASQAQKFDSEAEYIRQWLPEISSIATKQLVSGKIPDLERYRCKYPQPIVDHSVQQRRFKEIYKQQKNKRC